MNLRWLEDLQVLAKTRNFSGAARLRHTTQSTLSRHIQQLENWVGVKLVERNTHRVRLTSEGERFLEMTASTLEQIQTARREVAPQNDAGSEVVDFATTHSLALYFFPAWMIRLQRIVGALSLRLATADHYRCVETFLNRQVDYLLCFHSQDLVQPFNQKEFRYLILGVEALVPVIASQCADEAQTCLPGREDAPVPYLAYPSESFMGRAVEQARARFPPSFLATVYENSLAEAIKVTALRGAGLAWVPRSSVERELRLGALLPAAGHDWEIPLEIRLYCHRISGNPRLEHLWEQFEKFPITQEGE